MTEEGRIFDVCTPVIGDLEGIEHPQAGFFGFSED
jgi:hypothetical protein